MISMETIRDALSAFFRSILIVGSTLLDARIYTCTMPDYIVA